MKNLNRSSKNNFVHSGGTLFKYEEKFPYLSNYLLKNKIGLNPVATFKGLGYALLKASSPKLGNVTIYVTKPEEGSYTYGKNAIYIDVKPLFDVKPLTAGLDICLGFVLHEAAHLLYTDFSDFEAYSLNNLKKFIYNVIEDERIEYLLVEDMGGYSPYLEAVKAHCFKLVDKVSFKGIEGYLNAFLRYVRYPTKIPKEYNDFLKKVKEILSPYPLDVEGVGVATDKVYELLKSLSEQSDEMKKDFENLDAVAEKYLNIINQDVGEGYPFEIEEISPSKLEADLRGGHNQTSNFSNIVFIKGNVNTNVYLQSKRRVESYIPTVRNKILPYTNKRYTKQFIGAPSGSIYDLVGLVTNTNKNPFSQTFNVVSKKIGVIFLFDMSGSMYGEKIDACRELSILFWGAYKQYLESYFYGHTTGLPSYEDVTVWSFEKPEQLGSITDHNGNMDGYAMEAICEKHRHREGRFLFFVISDGLPNSRGGESGEEKIKKVIQKYKDKFIFVHIALGDDFSLKAFEHTVRVTNFVNLANQLKAVVAKLVTQYVGLRLTPID